LPQTLEEFAFDRGLARAAVRLAVARHCGTVETVHTVNGAVTVQRGKDLTHVAAVIGTGGPIVGSRDPGGILAMALADPQDPLSLRPRAPRLLLDRHYLLYACGLLSAAEPQAALELALAHLEPVAGEKSHERTRCA
jgi:uncharacterized protein (TIGR01319 family)